MIVFVLVIEAYYDCMHRRHRSILEEFKFENRVEVTWNEECKFENRVEVTWNYTTAEGKPQATRLFILYFL